MPPVLARDDSIIILGAGVFGLSTALHLARRGFSNVTVLDKQLYDETKYSYLHGCDAASADFNKIIRAAYGPEIIYQDLAFEAMEDWKEWNQYMAAGRDLPPALSQSDEIWVNNGNLQMCGQMELPKFEKTSIANMEKVGKRHTQVVASNTDDVLRAHRDGFGFAVDPFHRVQRGKPYQALLDTSGGFVYADKACQLALHLARRAGVKFLFGPAGEFSRYVEDHEGRVLGVRTIDGQTHPARLTVAACGGWTPHLVPELDGLCETTGGSVAVVKIPQSSWLFDRFAPYNFPTWTYKMRDGAEGGLYGFPRDESGLLKIGYRGVKYTNPQPASAGTRSIPITRWTKPSSLTGIPSQAFGRISSFIKEFLPEIAEAGLDISFTRMCWYNDSFDNHFVIDHVPKREGLMVATGGSGHAFMFFPNIGKYVADRIQGIEGNAQKFWGWRRLKQGQQAINVLGEGTKNPRALQNHQIHLDEGEGFDAASVKARL